jgi:hypothetical protein
MYCRWRFNEGEFLTGLTPPPLCPYTKPGPGFTTPHVMYPPHQRAAVKALQWVSSQKKTIFIEICPPYPITVYIKTSVFYRNMPSVSYNCLYKPSVSYNCLYKASVSYNCLYKPSVSYCCLYKASISYNCLYKPSVSYNCLYKASVSYNCLYKASVSYNCLYKPSVSYNCLYKTSVFSGLFRRRRRHW